MPRVKRSVHARKKRRKVLEQAKGYWGLKKSSYRYAKEQVEHSLVYAYRDRKNKKRTFRQLWIIRYQRAPRVRTASRTTSSSRGCARPGSSSTASRSPSSAGERPRPRSRSSPSRRRPGSRRPRPPEGKREAFLEQARHCDGRSPLYADLCRRLADDRSSARWSATGTWDVPLTCSAGCTTSCSPAARVLGRRAGGPARRGPFLRRSSASRGADERGAALVGAGAALPAGASGRARASRPRRARPERRARTSLWDRYAYRYGPALGPDDAARAAGEERGAVPAGSLARAGRPSVASASTARRST
jgi:ribosomal protein L20